MKDTKVTEIMKKRLPFNAFVVLSFLAFGTVFCLAGCSDNGVKPGPGPVSSDIVAPSQPTNLAAANVTATAVDLSWTISTDNVAVTGYNVYRGPVLVGSTLINSFGDAGLVSGSTYSYTVEAFDKAQNISMRSALPVSVTTLGPAPEVSDTAILKSVAALAILAGSTITNTGVSTHITGDVGLSPGTAVVGLPPAQVTGTIHINDAAANLAKSDLSIAYLNLKGRPSGVLVAGNMGGRTLAPGTYTSTSTLAISSGDLTLDAGGNANAVFIFQIASTLTVTSGRQVILAGGAQAKNVYWQVGSSATLGTTSVFKGTIIAQASVTLNTGATINGRVAALTSAVTLASNSVIKP